MTNDINHESIRNNRKLYPFRFAINAGQKANKIHKNIPKITKNILLM